MPIIIFQNIRQSFIDMIGYPIRAGTMKPLGGELDEDLHLKPTDALGITLEDIILMSITLTMYNLAKLEWLLPA